MKKILLLFAIFLTVELAEAQYIYTPNTYYFIPPSSGCDGVWAIEFPQTVCGSGVTYTLYPCGSYPHCWNGSYQIGDTMFLSVCCVPCSSIFIDNEGQWCDSIFVDFAASIKTNITESAFTISPNPTHDKLNVECNLPNAELKIYDMTGRVVQQEKLHSLLSTVNCQLSTGVYFIRVSVYPDAFGNGEKSAVQKLIVAD